MLDDEELAIEDNYGMSAGQTRLYSVEGVVRVYLWLTQLRVFVVYG